MALFQNIFKAPGAQPASPPPPSVPPVPASLPKITAPSAADICKTSQPHPAAQALLTPHQTPSQYLNALQQKHMGGEMVKTIAHGLPDREGVHWAAQSAQKVSDKLPPHELHAMQAAQNWVKSPTEANKSAAAAAASKTQYRGPGSWAAQGAAWSQPATPGATTPGAAASPRLTPHAVAGAVLSAAAIKANPALAAPAAKAPALPAAKVPALQAPKTPALPSTQMAAPQAPAPTVPHAVQAQTFKEQHPFISLGVDVASGKNTWA